MEDCERLENAGTSTTFHGFNKDTITVVIIQDKDAVVTRARCDDKETSLIGMNLISGGIADSREVVMGAGVLGIAVGKDVSSVVFGVGSLRG